jgi:hypothetical protein
MTARAKRIRAAAEGSWTPPQDALLNAVACMLDVATAKGKAVKVEPKLLVGVGAVFDAIKGTGKVLCEPIDNRWFGRLGKLLTQVSVSESNLAVLCDWLVCGGVDWWTNPPSFDHVFNNLAKWIGQAVKWDAEGREPIRGAKAESAQQSRPLNWVD